MAHSEKQSGGLADGDEACPPSLESGSDGHVAASARDGKLAETLGTRLSGDGARGRDGLSSFLGEADLSDMRQEQARTEVSSECRGIGFRGKLKVLQRDTFVPPSRWEVEAFSGGSPGF